MLGSDWTAGLDGLQMVDSDKFFEVCFLGWLDTGSVDPGSGSGLVPTPGSKKEPEKDPQMETLLSGLFVFSVFSLMLESDSDFVTLFQPNHLES